eukprot:8154110-Lingulodinium_polyedra.AAC.1
MMHASKSYSLIDHMPINYMRVANTSDNHTSVGEMSIRCAQAVGINSPPNNRTSINPVVQLPISPTSHATRLTTRCQIYVDHTSTRCRPYVQHMAARHVVDWHTITIRLASG